jgi:hypothetical protein
MTGGRSRSISPDFDLLVDEEGGPAAVFPGVQNDSLAMACRKVPFDRAESAFGGFDVDRSTARRYWPSVAWAVWLFERERRSASRAKELEIKPSQVRARLNRIAKCAAQLFDDLEAIEDQRVTFPRPGESEINEHAEALWRLLVEGTSVNLGPDGIHSDADDRPSPQQLLMHYQSLKHYLAKLGIAAQIAGGKLDEDRLRKTRGSVDPALPFLLRRLAVIWKSMTGAEPAVFKSESKNGADSSFVRFVQSVAAMTEGKIPTYSQIETAFRIVPTD